MANHQVISSSSLSFFVLLFLSSLFFYFLNPECSSLFNFFGPKHKHHDWVWTLNLPSSRTTSLTILLPQKFQILQISRKWSPFSNLHRCSYSILFSFNSSFPVTLVASSSSFVIMLFIILALSFALQEFPSFSHSFFYRSTKILMIFPSL